MRSIGLAVDSGSSLGLVFDVSTDARIDCVKVNSEGYACVRTRGPASNRKKATPASITARARARARDMQRAHEFRACPFLPARATGGLYY